MNGFDVGLAVDVGAGVVVVGDAVGVSVGITVAPGDAVVGVSPGDVAGVGVDVTVGVDVGVVPSPPPLPSPPLPGAGVGVGVGVGVGFGPTPSVNEVSPPISPSTSPVAPVVFQVPENVALSICSAVPTESR